MKYSKEEAIKIANDFIKEVNSLEKKYNMTFNSDTGDVYFSFKTNEENKVWDTISLGWDGDGSGIKVIESMEEVNKNKELDVSSSVYNGFRPNVYISDDLEDLKRRYAPEQLQKMWEEAYPKSSEISGKVIITGTPK